MKTNLRVLDKFLRLYLFLSLFGWAWSAGAAGVWTRLANQPAGEVNTMLLLPDGTVIAADADSETNWYRLTPDIHGSYINGTWSSLPPMHDSRLYYASDVLDDGRVFVAGGEYGSGTDSAEVFDPALGTWTFCPGTGQEFLDVISVVLSNFNVLLAPVWPGTYGGTMIYNPPSNAWSLGPKLVNGFDQDECSWVKLPDDSILTIDFASQTSERYIPSLNQWVADSSTPTNLFDPYGEELGAAFLLTNGNAFFIGSTPYTAIYTPSGTSTPGAWTSGANIPNNLGAPDAPAAMMADGNILCTLSPTPSSGDVFTTPSYFYFYNTFSNNFTRIRTPYGGNSVNQPTYIERMLDLPDGTVLYSDSSFRLYDYSPGDAPAAQGKPAITSITTNYYRSYHLTGTLLNGISQGAAYGDDAQMDSNYPLVRLTNSAGNVYYARTYDWSSTSVMNNNVTSTEFIVPTNLPAGTYSLAVVANGISSAPVAFAFTPDALQIGPSAGFAAAGPIGGPLSPASNSYTLTNTGAAPLNWSVNNTSTWLAISPASGALAAGSAQTVTVSLASSDSSLAVGTYNATVTFTNLTSGAIQVMPFNLQITPLIQNGDFETGSLAFWSFSDQAQDSFVADTGTYSTLNGISQSDFVHSGFYGAALTSYSTSATGAMSQTIATKPGHTYALSFWLDDPVAGSGNLFQAVWNGTNIYAETNNPAFAFTNLQFNLSATATNTLLQFTFQDGTNYFGLDDATLIDTTPAPKLQVAQTNGPTLVLTLTNAVPNQAYTLQDTTNLTPPITWQSIYTNTASATGYWAYTNSNLTTPPALYYRVVSP